MRVTREKAAENRARIVETASRLFREKGFDGVGLDAIMKEAGLTHGGFYGHFSSKASPPRGSQRELTNALKRYLTSESAAGRPATWIVRSLS
jgi:TetR/AcrR family transcriptional regulator, transcriptional repressor for nem operon